MQNKNSIYLHNFLNGIADSIVKVFVPVLILQYMQNLSLAFLYVAIYCLANLLSLVCFNKLILKYNISFLMVHILLFLATPILIALFNFNLFLVVVLALTAGFGQGFYYTPIENLYTNSTEKINMAKFDAFFSFSYFIFTLFSTYILTANFSNSLLFVCISATFFYLISLLPLIKVSKNLPKTNTIKINNYPKNKFYNLYFVFWMFSAVGYIISSMIVPIYMYTVNASIELIGIAIACTYLIEIAIDYLCKWFKTHNLQVVSMSIYFVLFTTSIVLLIIFKDNLIITIASVLCGLSYLFSYITMQDEFFSQIKKDDCASIGVLYKNIACFILRLITICTFFIFNSFLLIFILGIIFTFISLIITICLMKIKFKNNL